MNPVHNSATSKRASEGSEALPSLARRVRMSFFGARAIALVVWQRSDGGPAKRQGLCPKARFGALENSLSTSRMSKFCELRRN